MGKGNLFKLYTGEELCSMIVGSPHFDMKELEKVAIYDNGYNKDIQIIK